MSDRWKEFQQKNRESILSLKPSMTVTIYGSYHPKKEKDSLIDCKTALIADGYQQAKLVTDYPTTGSALDASKECLLYSDVNFLVFTKGGKRLGLVRELTFIATAERMRTKVDHCVVFDEFKKPPLYLSYLATT